MLIDLDAATPSQAYFHLTQTLVPRPIAWVLSRNANDSYNLAPFSYFSAVCSDPPLLMVSIGKRPDGSPKDTLANIRERKQFVVHIAHSGQIGVLNASAASLSPGESEVDALQLATCPFASQPIEGFALPRLTDARIAYACDCYRIDQIGNQTQALVFGRIHAIHVDDSIVEHTDKGRLKIDSKKLDPLARLGANEYLCAGQPRSLRRPN